MIPTVFYKPYIINDLTGNTINYSAATSLIITDIFISSGFTFILSDFDEKIINRLDIINNVINYVDNGNKYLINVLIINSGETIINSVTQLGLYCVKFSYSADTLGYFMMNVLNENIILTTTTSSTTTTTTTTINYPGVDITTPTIYYNSGETWSGGDLIIPYNVFLYTTGWTLNSLKILFINNVKDVFDDVPLSKIIIELSDVSGIPLNKISNCGIYNIKFYFIDNSGNIITNYISNIIVDNVSPIIVYKPYVLSILTGDTYFSGFTFNIFYKSSINRIDLIDNIISHVYDNVDNSINKYMLDVLITGNSGETYNEVSQIGEYLVKFSISDISENETIEYFIMTVIFDDAYNSLIVYNIPTKNDIVSDIFPEIDMSPIIYYNSSASWIGGGLTIPRNIFLHLEHDNTTGYTLDNLKNLFIDNVDCFNNVSSSEIFIELFDKSGIPLNSISNYGIYNITFLVVDSDGNNTINYISDIIVDDSPPIIVYNPYILNSNLSGNTTTFSNTSLIPSGISISSGFTFNIFYKESINRIDLINNIVNYVYDNVDNTINKYMLNILIVGNSGETINVTQIGEYCVKLVISDISGNETINYFIMNVIYDNSYNSLIVYNLPLDIIDIDLTGETITYPGVNINSPVIYYNSGISWFGGGTIIPNDIFLHLSHDNITGWTLDSLKLLFIDKIVDCFDGDITPSAITFNLFENSSSVNLSGIVCYGIYNIFILVTDSAGNNTINYISNIIVDDIPPIIVYEPYVLTDNLTGNTSDFSGATSAITLGIYISSGFTLNLSGFDENIINRLDIINTIVNYAYDDVDSEINKHMINILILGSHNSSGVISFTNVTKPGEYCVKFSLIDKSENEIINYFIMSVIYDVSTYSEGYWQDNKVWIDTLPWLDYNSIFYM